MKTERKTVCELCGLGESVQQNLDDDEVVNSVWCVESVWCVKRRSRRCHAWQRIGLARCSLNLVPSRAFKHSVTGCHAVTEVNAARI